MEGLYSRGKYLGEVRKFEKYNGSSRGIWEWDKRRRSMTSREEKRKIEDSGDGVESRGREV